MAAGPLSPCLRRRHLLGLLAAGAALGPRVARAADVPIELAQPAILTPAAAFGLFNNVTLAGSRLVAVGERGRIMLSDDAGAAWRQVPVRRTTLGASASR